MSWRVLAQVIFYPQAHFHYDLPPSQLRVYHFSSLEVSLSLLYQILNELSFLCSPSLSVHWLLLLRLHICGCSFMSFPLFSGLFHVKPLAVLTFPPKSLK